MSVEREIYRIVADEPLSWLLVTWVRSARNADEGDLDAADRDELRQLGELLEASGLSARPVLYAFEGEFVSERVVWELDDTADLWVMDAAEGSPWAAIGEAESGAAFTSAVRAMPRYALGLTPVGAPRPIRCRVRVHPGVPRR